MADSEQNVPETKNEPIQKEVTLSPIEEKALAEGWVPQDQWDGDPDQWRPAKEFLDRGELFKKIEDQNRTIKEFKRALDDMKQHHSKVREVEYQRALKALKEQKKDALESGDADAVIRLDDQIDLVKEEQTKLRTQPQVQEPAEVNPELSAWIEKNKWYETDRAMKAYADDLGRELALRGREPSDILVEVERQVKQEFAHKFRNPNRDKPNAVEGSSGKGARSKDDFVLTDEEKRIMERFVRTGALSKEEYIAGLKATRGA
jgi:hypothetical protein